MALRDDILRYLERFGPTGDRKLAEAHGTSNQHVNIVARGMSQRGEIRRYKGGDGLIQNALVRGGVSPSPEPAIEPVSGPSVAPTLLPEDVVKRALEAWLRGRGWQVDVAWGRSHGIDLEAHRGDDRLLVEAKGEAVLQPQQTNYFLSAIGELVQRSSDPNAIYALAFPDNRVYRGLVQRLPNRSREVLIHAVFFISAADGAECVELDAADAVRARL